MYHRLDCVRAALPLLLLTLSACAEPADAPGSEPIAWETQSPNEELHSTHLWIVDRAIDQLGRQGTTAATSAYRLLTKASCRNAWQQGLFDADYKAPYHGGWGDLKVGASETEIALAGATWVSHFYDPSTNTNYVGLSSPTARTETLSHGATARSRLATGDIKGGCYELGLALHYFTDITQPMHAVNFTATDSPTTLHSDIELRAMSIQSGFAIASTATLSAGTPAAEIDEAAWRSHDQWPALIGAVETAYAGRCGSIDNFPVDVTFCWQGDAGVDAAIGASLRTAQTATAELVLALDLPAR